MKSREEYGTPYTIGEARKAYELQFRQYLRDVYHREIVEWLLDQVERLQPDASVESGQ